MMAAVALSAGICFAGVSAAVEKQDYLKVLQDTAQDIESLKGEFPQLKDFVSTKVINPERLVIDYAYHTHRAERRGGWTSGVPNPDDDGVWFFIDFHEPDSRAQIHTQPLALERCLGDKRVSFLILEGKKTKSLEGRLSTVLKKHGVKRCEAAVGEGSPP
jgi:hypothetical protein